MSIIVLPSNAKTIIVGQPTISPELRKKLLKTVDLLWGPKEKEPEMKFYRVTCHTPFVGEEADFYIKCYNESDLCHQINDCVYDNGNDWYDEQTLEECDMSEDDYYAECGVSGYEEITREEYLRYCPWDREKDINKESLL